MRFMIAPRKMRRIVKAVLLTMQDTKRRTRCKAFRFPDAAAALLVIPGRALRANPQSSSFGHLWIPGSLAQARQRPGMTR
jgi:hypothetical protein